MTLGDRIAKHAKANSRGEKTEKPGHRVLIRKRFTKLNTMAEADVIVALFGQP